MLKASWGSPRSDQPAIILMKDLTTITEVLESNNLQILSVVEASDGKSFYFSFKVCAIQSC